MKTLPLNTDFPRRVDGWTLRIVERTGVFVTDAAARAELQNRNAALIAEAEAVVAALAAFDPFAVVVVDRTGTK